MSPDLAVLRRMARNRVGALAGLAAGALAGAVAQTLLPAALGALLDAVLAGRADAPGQIPGCAALLSIAVGGEAAVALARGIAVADGTAWLRRAMLRNVLSAGPAAARRFGVGDLTTRAVANAAEAANAPPAAITAAVTIVPSVGGLVALYLIDYWLAVAVLAGAPLLALLLRTFIRDTSATVSRYQEHQSGIAGRLVDALAGARTIAAAGTVHREVERILQPLAELRAEGESLWRVQGRVAGGGTLLVVALQALVLAVAGVALARGRLTPGELFAASQYAVLATGVTGAIGQLGRLARARAAARRAAEVLALAPTGYGEEELPAGPGRLELVGVRCGMLGAAGGLDLVVPGGAAVALVGASGAGKSLLAELAGRLRDPDNGEVLLDGVPLRRLRHGSLRAAVGYAFERPVLVGERLHDVISLGVSSGGVSSGGVSSLGVSSPGVSSPGAATPGSDQVRSAAVAACADAFVARLPDGYATSPDDAPLSGGEIQRLGLARAFAQAERVLILDDATSSLDTATEMQVSRALVDDLGGLTRLIVAHRVTTAARADLVAWLDGGRIRRYGPHDVLWHDPRYRAVFEP